ncbi:SpoIIE family protein phosphatase [Streptomyces avicenniae]|uniref:SpoIIE family protein phosphatase n=1 Tax=Streptomyces avicenniae TaxID=500153 RepID=UPI00069BAB58|nr:SpoIIE family protein phosphatase [Streptomyces avicenniae]
MSATPHPPAGQLPGGASLLFVVGADGEIRARAGESEGLTEELTGRPFDELAGRLLPDLLADPGAWAALAAEGRPAHRIAGLRHRDGRVTDVRIDLFPMDTRPGVGSRFLAVLTPGRAARRQDEDRALLRALFTQHQVGIAIHDADMRVTRMNTLPGRYADPGPQRDIPELPQTLDALMHQDDAAEVLARLEHVARTGEPLIYWEHSARLSTAPERDRVLAVTALRLTGADGRVLGVVSIFTDITEQHLARRRLAMLHAAAERIGPSLDVTRNAEELADLLVPDFADIVTVDLGAAVLAGDDPGITLLGPLVRRVATASSDGRWPGELHRAGALFRVEGKTSTGLDGHAVLEPREHLVRSVPEGEVTEDGPYATKGTGLLPEGPGSLMLVPLRARGQELGILTLWRQPRHPAFTRQDADLAEEIGSRAALSLDNARRYTREHRTLETLQRSLLPQPVFELPGARTAGSYIPAATAAGLGGSWYDVIPLSSARVAFVIGDVAGHGLNATATMGRLRTAVQTLADLDLAPDELLTRLDDLAIRLADTQPDGGTSPGGAVGATCLYCVYDPVSGQCVLAAAGRVPPLLALPGRAAEEIALKAGPPLGVGGTPFESVRVRLDPGSLLVLFSQELVAPGPDGRNSEERMALLRERVTEEAAHSRSPADTGHALLDALLPGRAPDNDVALLVARVQPLPPDATADWQFPADAEVVGRARDAVIQQLKNWNLTGNAFPTELIVSELVTNAIRYAGGPIGLRLILNDSLVCEVSDPSETQPHLRRARPTDEGGRGLFLVAQLAHRWGSRYTGAGKTIWTEQPLDRD